MSDSLEKLKFYQMSLELWEKCWTDTEILMRDQRGIEIARQLIRSVGSVSANIEEGYGRGFGKEYPQFLRIARGSARESKGWYLKSKHLLNEEIIQDRVKLLSSITAMITATLETISKKSKFTPQK